MMRSALATFCLKYAGMGPKVSYLAFSLNCLLEAVLKCTLWQRVTREITLVKSDGEV